MSRPPTQLVAIAVIASLYVVSAALGPVVAAYATPPEPTVSTGATDDGFYTTGNKGGNAARDTVDSGVETRVNDCGAPPTTGHVVVVFDDPCSYAQNNCAGMPSVSPTGQPVTILSTQTNNPAGQWIQGPVNCSATATPPGLDQAALHDAFVKLLPHPGIKSAPPNTRALVNVQTLIWLNTPQDVNLGTTALLGNRVTLIASVQTVTWDLGDHHTDTTPGPGTPFTTTDHCATITCPNWFGHTYTTTGNLTITATITWTGRYSINNNPYQPITTTVTTPTTTPIHIFESRTVLVPNPEPS